MEKKKVYHKKAVDQVIMRIAEFVREEEYWTGSATELLSRLPELDLKPNIITRRLNVDISVLYNDFDIKYTYKRSGDKRTITLIDLKGLYDDKNDGMTVNDDISKTGTGYK